MEQLKSRYLVPKIILSFSIILNKCKNVYAAVPYHRFNQIRSSTFKVNYKLSNNKTTCYRYIKNRMYETFFLFSSRILQAKLNQLGVTPPTPNFKLALRRGTPLTPKIFGGAPEGELTLSPTPELGVCGTLRCLLIRFRKLRFERE